MNWKFEAIEKLKDYELKKRSLDSIPVEIKMLEIQMASIRSATSDGSPVQGGGSGREDMYLSNIVKREELGRSLDLAKRWVAIVDGGLELLSEEDRLILDRFFISPAKGNVDRLCEELSLEKSAVYDRRNKALRRFTLSLYGCSEI